MRRNTNSAGGCGGNGPWAAIGSTEGRYLLPIPAWLLLGWSLPALFVFGAACFTGQTINCPSDLLMLPGFHTSTGRSRPDEVKNDNVLMDLVRIAAPAREFMAEEYREGRIPVWNPAIFCGTPFAIANKFSPFELLYVAIPVPQTLVWMQLAQSVVMGLGTYLFLRRSLAVSRPAAVVGSTISPYLGFLTVWQGFTSLTASVCWLPWLLYSTDAVFQRPFSRATAGLALVTAMAVVCGAADITALVLVTAGLRLLWHCAIDGRLDQIGRGASSATVGWMLGLLIASPHLLPLLEYSGTGARMAERSAGAEERPPIGAEALWQLVVPEFFGGSRPLLTYVGPAGNMPESTGGAYLGTAAILFIALGAPWLTGRRRELMFWIPLAILGIGWQIDLPVIVFIERLWPLNMLSWNRAVFMTAFSQLVLITLVFDAFGRVSVVPRYGLRAAAVALGVALIILIMYRWTATEPPEHVRVLLARRAAAGIPVEQLQTMLLEWRRGWAIAAAGCFALAAGFLLAAMPNRGPKIAVAAFVLALCLEPVMFARLQRRTAPASTYFPEVPILMALQGYPRGRMIGVQCLLPNLAQPWHVEDVRGYDAVDPMRITRLLGLAADRPNKSPKYARTQWMEPLLAHTPDGSMRLPPILDMLNVRYIVLASKPSVSDVPILEGDGFWILENKRALPRVFVPSEVIPAADDQALAMMSNPDFEPANVAFSEPSGDHVSNAEGVVAIESEHPTVIRMTASMVRPGVVVLADSWHPDWSVRVDGNEAKPLRLNTAVRGVGVPAGDHEIVWEYRPRTMLRTAPWAGAALLVCLAWALAHPILTKPWHTSAGNF